MKKICWVGMVDRGENSSLTMGDRLYATLSLLRWITVEYQYLQKEHERLQKACQVLSAAYSCYVYSPKNTGRSTGSKMNGGTLAAMVPDIELEKQSAELRKQSLKHRERLDSWQQACREFCRLRLLWERHEHKSLNYWQTQVYSLFWVSHYDPKWDGCLNHIDTIEGINGNLLVSDWFHNPELWKRHSLNRKGLKQGKRVSAVYGTELCKFHSMPVYADTRPRFTQVYGKLNVLKTVHPIILRYCEICPGYRDSQNAVYSPPANIFREILQTFRYLRDNGITADNVASLRRLSEVSSGIRNAVVGVVVGRPENIGECFISHNGEQYELQLLRWKFFALQGGEYWEYGVTRQSVQSLPTDFLRHVVSSVQTYHNDDSDASTGMLTLADRIRRTVMEASQREVHYLKNAAFAEQQKQELRCKQANILRKLRNVDSVSVQDSVKSGNCKPGTLGFMTRIGIGSDVEQIPGRKLATLWKKAGKPHEPLFFRMVDLLVANGGGN